MENNYLKREVISAYTWIRENNHSIPDDILDLMKNAALEHETLKAQNESLCWDVTVLAVENKDLIKDNALLIEALEKCIVQFEGIVGYGNRDDEAAINKAKELLNKHKNDKHENKTIG